MDTRITVIDMRVHIASKERALGFIKKWLSKPWNEREGRSICFSNVHMCMEVKDCNQFKKVVNESDLVLPDGKPLHIAQKLFGFKEAEQVRGTDMTLKLCQLSHEKGYSIGFYGGAQKTLDKLEIKLRNLYPNINIQLLESPPFRALTKVEDQAYINMINEKEIDILFVGLGCPKQEKWMADHRDQVKSVMLGVGAAFDFISGNKKHAPRIMQKLSLEWAHRFSCEPRRLFKRYMKQNPRFVFHFSKRYFPKKRALSKLRRIKPIDE